MPHVTRRILNRSLKHIITHVYAILITFLDIIKEIQDTDKPFHELPVLALHTPASKMSEAFGKSTQCK